jgi:succinate-semialdehyde dehydrogenase / glutarate-semialdehyde dehydrogenase
MTYRSVNPATGEVTRSFDSISDAELSHALETAHSCYENDWRKRPVGERVAVVKAAAADLRTNVAAHAESITAEVGKLFGTSEAEVMLSAAILDYYADRAEKLLAPQHISESPGAVVETVPIGVILAIEPWNFPYYQLARVVAPQLIAGNVVVAKHAESVPQCALAFARLFAEAGAPAGAYTNVFASVEQIGRAIEDPRVAGVTFTGSERAGADVAQRAGHSVKKVVMELGGSDPFIVLDDADLDQAVAGAMFGRMFNTGQSCVGSKRIIVVGSERGERFLSLFTAQMAAQKPGDPMDPQTALGPVSSEPALELLLEQVRTAKDSGARVVTGGSRIDREGFYIEPTVLTDIDPANPAFDTEFFGPVASFYIVDSQDEAIKLANATRFGLGAAVFTADLDRGRSVAALLDSGMVFINQPAWTGPEIPFGGTKSSGFGRELSELGFGEFVNRKLVNVAPAGSPPWGPVEQ